MKKMAATKTQVFLQNPLDFSGDLTAVGWQLPDTITRDQYEDAGRLLGKMEDSKQWWLGDWWNAGAKWGEGQAICDKVGVSYDTAKTAGSISGRFDLLRRRNNLTFSHHREVLALPTEELQDKFLDWCLVDTDTGEPRDKAKSVCDLRDAVRSYLDAQAWSDSEKERRAIIEAGGTVVAHQKEDTNLIRWAQFNNIYQKIDRPSEWSNPFKLNEDGDRDQVCDHFAVYLDWRPGLLKKIGDLRGKVLGCWCHPERCHGDEIVRRLKNDF